LRPAEVQEIALCFEINKATVVVADDQLSLAIGKRGQNVRLAARLTGWDIDIVTPGEYNKGLDEMEQALRAIEAVDDTILDKLVAMGIINLHDLATVGKDPLVQTLEVAPELAEKLVTTAKQLAPQRRPAAAARAVDSQAEETAPEAAGTAHGGAAPQTDPGAGTSEDGAMPGDDNSDVKGPLAQQDAPASGPAGDGDNPPAAAETQDET